MDTELRTIIRRAIDMHVHVGPEIIPRRYTAANLATSETGKLAGAVLKNHFYQTAPLVVANKDFTEYGAVVLNWPAGGLNVEAIRAAAYISTRPFIVWLPTIHAANFLDNSDYEIAPEWCSGSAIAVRKASQVVGICLTDVTGDLTTDAKRVARTIKRYDAILATGHVSVPESIAIAEYALSIGVRGVIITHPIYQRISMPVSVQRRLAALGCFMEVCYSMYLLDGIALSEIIAQIVAIGPERTILSSDVGQLTSDPPSVALLKFCRLLVNGGIPVKWLEMMLVQNPRLLLGDK